MFNPFTALRTAAKNSILNGIQDAVNEMAADGQAAVFIVQPLALTTTPSVAAVEAPKDGEPDAATKGRRKAG